LEWIRVVAQYLSPEYRDNLEQFLKFHPAINANIAEHDEGVQTLTDACRKLHTALVTKSELPRLYEELSTPEGLRSVWEQSRFRHLPLENTSPDRMLSEFFGGFDKSEHVSVLAEYIINNTGDLPDHYTTAPFWNAYRERLVQLLKAPDVRKESREVNSAGANLREASSRLSQSLQEIRLDLSIKHDVPYVDPMSVPKSEPSW
jgi:hypothetical protein